MGPPPEVLLVLSTGQAADRVPRQPARLQLLDAERPQGGVQAALGSSRSTSILPPPQLPGA